MRDPAQVYHRITQGRGVKTPPQEATLVAQVSTGKLYGWRSHLQLTLSPVLVQSHRSASARAEGRGR